MGNKKIIIVGVGGTGCHVLPALLDYSITIIDGDVVQESNLNRQTLYSNQDIGKKKVDCISFDVTKISEFISVDNNQLLADADIVIDCTDNFQARFVIDAYCKAHNIPWIYTAAIRDIGNILFVDSNVDIHKLFDSKKGNACSDGIQLDILQLIGEKTAHIVQEYFKTATYPKELLRFNTTTGEELHLRIE